MNLDLVEKLLKLSALSVTEKEQHMLFADLRRIIELVDQMQEIDTAHIEPLRHPVDLSESLRKDVADFDIETEIFQDIAPKTEDGFYLVPRVIE